MIQTATKSTQTRSYLKEKIQSKYLVKGSIIILIITLTPFIFYAYSGFPDGPILETAFFTYESGYFHNVSTFAWIFLSKLITLVLLLVWFFTCKHWWYFAILIPITMYMLQIISLIGNDLDKSNLVEIYFLAPVIIFVLAILYTIRTKIFDGIHNIDLSEINKYLEGNSKSWWN